MMLRGFCPMGDKCPYDHPPRAGESATSPVIMTVVLLHAAAHMHGMLLSVMKLALTLRYTDAQ